MSDFQHTVIAAFNNDSSAEDAAAALTNAGIPPDSVNLESSSKTSSSYSQGDVPHEHGIKGWFKSLFSAEHEQDRNAYEQAYQRGYSLLRIEVDEDRISAVEDILNRFSPVDVHEEQGQTSGIGGAAYNTTEASSSRGTSGSVPVIDEELQVGKRRVLRGGVRVFSRVSTEPVEENVTLREERIRVDRQPVNRAATEADFAAARDQVIEVQEFAEQPVVAKTARVVEEVRVGKDVSERTETIRDNVRRTDVNVERQPASGSASYGGSQEYDDSDFRSDFQSRYADGGESYDTYAPAYRYGYTAASDPRYQGRSYDDIESDLRDDYSRQYPTGTWDRVKNSVRYGWDKVSGKSRAAAR